MHGFDWMIISNFRCRRRFSDTAPIPRDELEVRAATQAGILILPTTRLLGSYGYFSAYGVYQAPCLFQGNEGMCIATQAAKLCQAAVWLSGCRICCTTTMKIVDQIVTRCTLPADHQS